MLYYAGSYFVLFKSYFRTKDSPFFDWQTRKLSASNQQWSLWLYTKYLMDMFPRFWIRKPSIFYESTQLFNPYRGFPLTTLLLGILYFYFFKAWKAIDSLTCVLNFLLSDVYLSLLFNFKIESSLGLSCLMSSMFIIILIIRIIKATYFKNTILMTDLKGKLP